MGAAVAAQDRSADVPAAGSQHKVCIAACVSEAQRRTLEAEIVAGAGAERADGVAADEDVGHRGREARGDGVWEVYYDRVDFALTLRGWWLRERAGQWLLRAPAEGGGYEDLTAIEEILVRVGLAAYADAWQKWSEKQRNLEKLLHQASVVPFARFRVVEGARSYALSPEAPGAEAAGAAHVLRSAAALGGPGAELLVGLETLHLDVKFAEDEAVSKLLFTLGGAAARKVLRTSLLELTLVGGALAEEPTAAAARAKLDESLRTRGLITIEGPCPRVMAYIETLRPAHRRALLRFNAVPSGEAAVVH